MDPKIQPKGPKFELRSHLFQLPKRFENSDSFFCGFGVPLDAFWHPFRRLLDILGAFWPPSGAFWPPSGCLFGSLWKFFGPPRTCRDFDENFRELAEISPRTCPPDTRKIPIGPIIGFYNRSDLTIMFLLSGRWSWTLYLGTKDKRPHVKL